MKQDQIFAHPLEEIVDFQFDEHVVNVFPDMIKRSVPGYSTIIAQISAFAKEYAQPNSNCYDLGCSLGASTMMLQQGIDLDSEVEGCKIIGIDNSTEMIRQCQVSLDRLQATKTPIELRCENIEGSVIENASIVVLNFTLQFIAPERRRAIVETIYNGLRPGGILILSEKVRFASSSSNQWMIDRHHDFKRQNGYSTLEISQKRTALENVLITEPLERHISRLNKAGFTAIHPWFQCYNFVSIFAAKEADR